MDIGGYTLAVNLPDHSIGDIKMINTSLAGKIKEGPDQLSACVDLISGTFNDIYLTNNSFIVPVKKENKEVIDFINVQNGCTIQQESSYYCKFLHQR